MWQKREKPNLKAFFKALILLFPPQIHFLKIFKEKKTPSFQGVISYPHKALYDGLDLKNEISNNFTIATLPTAWK